MKYKITLNGKTYEVEVEEGQAMLVDEYEAYKPAAPAAAPASAPKAVPALATGTAGECKLYNVGDREAAMLMAIVANKLGKPLNTLRFKSMKEVI